MTQGLQPGQLIILAGGTGHGKSSLAVNIIANVIGKGGTVGLFTVEMGATEIVKRLISGESEVNTRSLRDASRDDWRRIVDASAKLADTKLHIDESAGLTIMDMRARAHRLASTRKPDLIVVDYLQIMSPTHGPRERNRVQEVTEISRGLKILAKDLGVPIIALSQLNRDYAKEKRRPELRDLRDSGSIEQDADIVMFIWRDMSNEKSGQAELIIGKQRNGPVGTIYMQFIAQFTKFVLAAKPDQEKTQPKCWYNEI